MAEKFQKWNKSARLLYIFCGLFLLIPILNAQITVDIKNQPIKQALRTIERSSSYKFFYNAQLPDLDKRVTLKASDFSIDKAMEVLLNGTRLSYEKRAENQIAIIQSTSKQQVQGGVKKITGTVVDEKGETVIGANVSVKGTAAGTITDVEGRFSIDARQGQTLQVSFIGYQTGAVSIGSQSVYRITLQEDAHQLNEVVVTALGVKREEKALGYSVQAVKGSTLQTVKGIDVSSSLTGKVAGLRVNNSSEFFSEAELSLRGETPLLVIDGVPYKNMTLRDLPADDIESINVLKGATASALYGSQGSSGAVMVTTKRGLDNKGVVVNINSGTMFNAGFLAIPELQSTFGRAFNTRPDGDFEVKRDSYFSWGMPMDGRMVYQWDPIQKIQVKKPYLPVGKDNFENFLEQGYVLNNNVSITQQGEYGSFRTSASWVNNKGIYPNSHFNKLTFSAGGDMKINKFSLSANLSYNKQFSPNKGFSGFTGYEPMIQFLVDGTVDYDVREYKDYWLEKDKVQNSPYTNRINNPYFDRYERTHSVNRDMFNANFTMNYDFLPWLKGMFRLGYDMYSVRQEVKVSQGSFTGAGSATIGGAQVWGESLKGSFNVGIDRGYSIMGDAMMMANKSFGKLNVDGFLGISSNFGSDEYMGSFTQSGLSMPGWYSLKASVGALSTNSALRRKQTNSVFGKVGVSWGSFIFAEATFRNDWVSTLSKDARSYLYPSFSGSFLPSEFLKDLDWLSMWKLRGSWTMSKTPADIYAINQKMSVTNPAWGALSSAAAPTTIYPSTLQPQQSSTFEVGTMVSVLKNRLSVDFTYYDRRGKNYIVSAPVAPTSGYSNVYVNSDEIRSRRGVEIMISGTPIQTKDFKWKVSANWSKDAEYYVQIDETYTPDRDKPWVGKGKRTDFLAANDFQRQPGTGEIIYLNGLPQYSSYMSNFGYHNPEWYWGLDNTLSYKNFTLGVTIDGRVGGKIISYTQMYMWAKGSHPESVTEERRLDAINPGSKNYLGQGVKVVSGSVKFDPIGNILEDTRVFAPNDVKSTYQQHTATMHREIGWSWEGAVSPLDVLSGTFAKIREISLTYDLPRVWVKKVKLNEASVSLIGQNLFMIAKDFKYSDPDGVNRSSKDANLRTENFADPSFRWLGFNVKLSF